MTKEEYIERKRELDASISKLEEEKKRLVSEYRYQFLDEYRYLMGKKVICYDELDHGRYLGEAYLTDLVLFDVPGADGVTVNTAVLFEVNDIVTKDGSRRRPAWYVTRIEPVEEK